MRAILIVATLFAFGCGDENTETEEECIVSSQNYLYTSFDCEHYIVSYKLCHKPEQDDCVCFPPEEAYGHCIAENFCQTFFPEEQITDGA